MKYLSIDLEATGLAENDLIIEFAAVPFDSSSRTIEENLTFHHYIQCPSFEKLKPNLDPWVIEHNKDLITKAHLDGISLVQFQSLLKDYLLSSKITEYFENQKITLFGKSMNAIDLPFLNRDLSWSFIREFFNHQQLDLSSIVYAYIDMNLIPATCTSGSELMKFLNMGEVCHTALEDSINTAKMYLELLEKSVKA